MAGIAASGLAFTIVWSLMGRPEPLSQANVRRAIQTVRETPAKRRIAKRKRERRAEEMRLEQEQTETETKLKDALRSAVVRLHEMESGNASCYPAEWKMQKRLCKEAVFDIVQYIGYRFCCTGSNWDNVACTNYETDTIIFHVTKSRWRKRTLQLYILVHPLPTLSSLWPELDGGAATVLSMPLTASDLEKLGWEFPDRWESLQSKRIPGRSLPELMSPDVIRARRVRDWVPDSPFAGTKLPE